LPRRNQLRAFCIAKRYFPLTSEYIIENIVRKWGNGGENMGDKNMKKKQNPNDKKAKGKEIVTAVELPKDNKPKKK
jgi:hypothetical protein